MFFCSKCRHIMLFFIEKLNMYVHSTLTALIRINNIFTKFVFNNIYGRNDVYREKSFFSY